MNTSTYYNLNLVEGTDIVNPLTTDVPNYETIDEVMHNNAISGVTLATEVANGTTHALIRENSECAVIRFIATSNWTLGDTITVDGIPVVALLPSGEVLPSGAYVINANVLCILTGTNLTVYAERKKANNADEIAYNDTTVGAELVRLDDELTEVSESLELSTFETLLSAIEDTAEHPWSIDGYKKVLIRVEFENYSYEDIVIDVKTLVFASDRSGGILKTATNSFVTSVNSFAGAQIRFTTQNVKMSYVHKGSSVGAVKYSAFGMR